MVKKTASQSGGNLLLTIITQNLLEFFFSTNMGKRFKSTHLNPLGRSTKNYFLSKGGLNIEKKSPAMRRSPVLGSLQLGTSEADIPYQKVIVYLESVFVCNGHPPIQVAHPCLIWCAMTQNQALTSLQEVRAYIIGTGYTHGASMVDAT